MKLIYKITMIRQYFIYYLIDLLFVIEKAKKVKFVKTFPRA